MIYGPQEISVYIYLHLVPFAPSLSPAAAMSKARVLKKSDSHASDAEAVVDLELLKQASSRVADADALAKGDAVYDFAEENLKGFHSLFTQEFEEQARLASHVHLTWASGCSGSEGAFYVMEAVSRAYSLCSGTCALKVSLKHTFSCEAQADKQRWIQAVLDCGPLKNMDGGADSSESSDAADSKGCLFNDIQTLGETHAERITHGQKCKVPRCDIFVIGSSCKDLSKANPKKETQKLVFHEATSLGGSAQTYQGFTSYVKAHSPGIVVYENVDGLEETIGASAQSNLDILMGTMKALGYKGQPLRTDAAAFGLPARRRRLYVLFVRQVNPKFNTQTRSLTKSFDMFGSLVASCLRSPPCAKELLLDSTSTEVNEFLEERKRHRAAQASKTQKSASSWTDQHMKFAEAEGLRWGQPHPESLKVNEFVGAFQGASARSWLQKFIPKHWAGAQHEFLQRNQEACGPHNAPRSVVLSGPFEAAQIDAGSGSSFVSRFSSAWLSVLSWRGGGECFRGTGTLVQRRENDLVNPGNGWQKIWWATWLEMPWLCQCCLRSSRVRWLRFFSGLAQTQRRLSRQLMPFLHWGCCQASKSMAGSTLVHQGHEGLAHVSSLPVWQCYRCYVLWQRSKVRQKRGGFAALRFWRPVLPFLLS